MESSITVSQANENAFCKCGYVDCVCTIRKIHEKSCYYRKVAESFVTFACKEHDLEVCPKCDKCSCSEEFKIERLKKFQKKLIEKEYGPLFMGLPDRWYEEPGPKYRCTKNHVSERYLKSELLGNVCLSCATNIILTYPEDEEC